MAAQGFPSDEQLIQLMRGRMVTSVARDAGNPSYMPLQQTTPQEASPAYGPVMPFRPGSAALAVPMAMSPQEHGSGALVTLPRTMSPNEPGMGVPLPRVMSPSGLGVRQCGNCLLPLTGPVTHCEQCVSLVHAHCASSIMHRSFLHEVL